LLEKVSLPIESLPRSTGTCSVFSTNSWHNQAEILRIVVEKINFGRLERYFGGWNMKECDFE
jgi:hypothetical protein